jgi:hypothetical protein
VTVYTVIETASGVWHAYAGDTFIGRRPKKEPAKLVCQQTAGRRQLTWTWDAKTRTYTSDEA